MLVINEVSFLTVQTDMNQSQLKIYLSSSVGLPRQFCSSDHRLIMTSHPSWKIHIALEMTFYGFKV